MVFSKTLIKLDPNYVKSDLFFEATKVSRRIKIFNCQEFIGFLQRKDGGGLVEILRTIFESIFFL